MILFLRFALFAAAFAFASLFGDTLQRFLLEVVRHFVAVEPSNALLFNFFHLATGVVPILLFGAVGSLSLSGERLWTRRLWEGVLGLVLAMALVRGYQVAWILSGGVGGAGASGAQRYLLETGVPFALLGVGAALPAAMLEETNWKIMLIPVIFAVFCFFWMEWTGKLLGLSGFGPVFGAFLWCVLTAFWASFAVRKIRTF